MFCIKYIFLLLALYIPPMLLSDRVCVCAHLTQTRYAQKRAEMRIIMNTLPKDPVMLLSFVNMQLRDNYNSLAELCKTFMVDENVITDKLGTINYQYDVSSNQFK